MYARVFTNSFGNGFEFILYNDSNTARDKILFYYNTHLFYTALEIVCSSGILFLDLQHTRAVVYPSHVTF